MENCPVLSYFSLLRSKDGRLPMQQSGVTLDSSSVGILKMIDLFVLFCQNIFCQLGPDSEFRGISSQETFGF